VNVDKGSTNVSVNFYITQDVGGTNPGEPKTGMAFGDLTSASYARQGAARVAITPVIRTVAEAHSDGGFVEIDATNMPGLYRFDPPDAAFATGVDFVTVALLPAGAQNAVVSPLAVDLNEAMRGTESALLAANVPANFSSLVISAGGAVDSLVQGFLNTLITESTAARIADNFSTLYDNGDAASTAILDTITDILTDSNAIKVITDQFVFTVGNQVDSNSLSVGGTTQTANDNSASILALIATIGVAGLGLTDLGGMSVGMKAEIESEVDDSIAGLNDISVADIFITAMTEAYAADGATNTLAQILYMLLANLTEFSNAGTTRTAKRLDGSTTAGTFTYDDGTNPTSITRAT